MLFNQFHDILPGSAIKEVHERTEKSYAQVISEANLIINEVLETVPEENTVSVFNALPWEREELIELPDGYTLKNGVAQRIGDRTVASVTVPSCSACSYTLVKEEAADACTDGIPVLENRFLRLEFNRKGEMISLYDKENKIEFLQKPSNVFRMYQDMPTFCDAWDIDSFYENVEVALEDARIKVECKGELVSSLLITKRIGDSELKQRVVLSAFGRRIDFETEVDWKETHKLLKVDFHTNVHTNELLSETQFGYVSRPTHSNRQFDADRFEVCQHKWSALCESRRGVAILNDCKYGISARDGSMGLTLLKSGANPDLNADKGHHTFKYAIMPFAEAFCDSDVIRQAYQLNAPLRVKTGKADTVSLIKASKKNIIVDTVKLAEDGSGDLIVRLYEATNTYTNVTLQFGFAIASAKRTDLLENEICDVETSENEISIAVKAFEVVTLKIGRKSN